MWVFFLGGGGLVFFFMDFCDPLSCVHFRESIFFSITSSTSLPTPSSGWTPKPKRVEYRMRGGGRRGGGNIILIWSIFM